MPRTLQDIIESGEKINLNDTGTVELIKAELLTDENAGGDKQTLKQIFMTTLEQMFRETPSYNYVNKTGTQDKAGNIVYTKVAFQKPKLRDGVADLYDLDRFKDMSTVDVFVRVTKHLENPVRYISPDIEMGASGVLEQTRQGMNQKILEYREELILLTARDTALAEGNLIEDDFDAKTTEEIIPFLDKMIIQLKNQTDTGVSKVKGEMIVLMLGSNMYNTVLNKFLRMVTPVSNEFAFKNGTIEKYKGINLIENIYIDTLENVDGTPANLRAIAMINGAIAAPWRPKGVTNDKMLGTALIYLLNIEIYYGIGAIYPKHIIALKQIDAPAPAVKKVESSSTAGDMAYAYTEVEE